MLEGPGNSKNWKHMQKPFSDYVCSAFGISKRLATILDGLWKELRHEVAKQ